MPSITIMSQEECRARYDATLLTVARDATLPLDDIKTALAEHGFCTLRGIVTPVEAAARLDAFRARFSATDDHPSTGEDPRAVQRNFQKLKAGISPLAPTNSRLVRNFFNPLWEEDIFGLHEIYRRMIVVRNALIGKPPGYITDRPEDGFWTASRLQQYPRGGGFMSAHTDSLVSDQVVATGMEYVQLLLMITQKGADYERGGGFTIKDERFIDAEQFCQRGDIVVYDASILHGVDTIDPHLPLELDSPAGRVVGFVTLYKDWAG